MSIDFSPLYSSSSGNCIFVRAGSANILIDAGVTAKKIVNSLNAINIDPSNIDGILLTHEHSDHIKGAGVLSRKFDIPIYANHATWDAIGNKIGDIHLKNTCEFFDSFYIDDMLIEPICIPHDAADPVCYSIGYKNYKFSVMTDLGHYTKKIIDKLAKSNVVILESNHDIDMLQDGSYPSYLKKRILGTKGHLSNETAGKAAVDLALAGVKGILLGHLSENNNTHTIAYNTVKSCLEYNGVEIGKNIALFVLSSVCNPYIYTIGTD